ncbi:putative acyl-CoA desaturase [Helianthus anomalus]
MCLVFEPVVSEPLFLRFVSLFHTQRKKEMETRSDFKHNSFAAAVGRNRRSGSCAPRVIVFGSKWRSVDIKVADRILFLYVLAHFAQYTFSWDAFSTTFLLYLLIGILGITMCYRRLLAHHSLKLPKWLEYTFA